MCFEPWNRVCHWGPLVAIAIIKAVSFTTLYCCTMWWPPRESFGGLLNVLTFSTFSALTLYNLFTAMYEGPGFVPFGWKPADKVNYIKVQFCNVCQGYKAPRAHHCRKCNRCVLKMDHHCPWINNCVGHNNHTSFTIFLLTAVLGCFQATVIICSSLYYAINRVWYIYYGTGHEPKVIFGIYMFVFSLFSLGLAIGVVVAVGMLLYIQLRSIYRNQTGIEDWIIEKAKYRRKDTKEKFIYPYNLGWRKNCEEVLNLNCTPRGDGFTWPIVEGCDQYTLTVEQIEQKEEKKLRMREYSIVEEYSGSWFPITKGIGTCCHPPYSDEARIRLVAGDKVKVTRWKKYWLYGEKDILPEDIVPGQRIRGWFPRRCAVELACSPGCSNSSTEIGNKKTK